MVATGDTASGKLFNFEYNWVTFLLFITGRETYKELCHVSCERYSPVRRGSEGTCPLSPRLAKSTPVSRDSSIPACLHVSDSLSFWASRNIMLDSDDGKVNPSVH